MLFAALRERHRRHLQLDLATQRASPTSPTTTSPTTRRSTRPTASPSSIWRASAGHRSCSASISTPEEDAAHFRHARRSVGEVPDDDTLIFSSTATDPAHAADAGRGAQRQHLQPVVAEPEEWRAEAVHRRAGRQSVTGRAARTAPAAASAFVNYYKGDYTPAQLRSEGTAAHGRRRATSARPDPSSTSRRRCSTRWCRRTRRRRAVREDVPRRPAAGERRRHERRRRVRRHAGLVRGRPRRSSSSTSSRRRSQQYKTMSFSYLNLSRRFQCALAGLPADAVLLRQLPTTTSSTTRPDAVHRPRRCARHPDGERRHRSSRIYPFSRYRACRDLGRRGALQRAVRRSDRARRSPQQYQQEQFYGSSSSQRPAPCRSASRSSRRHGVPRVRPVLRQHHAAGVRRSPEGRQLALLPDASIGDARNYMRHWRDGAARIARSRASRAWARHRLHLLRRQLRAARLRLPRFLGHKGFYANAELRFPLIDAMADAASAFSAVSAASSSRIWAGPASTGFRLRCSPTTQP